jgi:hypothetical protein
MILRLFEERNPKMTQCQTRTEALFMRTFIILIETTQGQETRRIFVKYRTYFLFSL